MPKGVRLNPEQIVAKLWEIEVKLSQGKDVMTACREACTTDKSYYRWRREYGVLKVDQARRLKQLEKENARSAWWGNCVRDAAPVQRVTASPYRLPATYTRRGFKDAECEAVQP